jgi:ABC-type polysaccharide/polyol phosphate export permease
MLKQNIYTAFFTGISQVTNRITHQNNYFSKFRNEANVLHWIQRTYTAAPAKTRQLVKIWLTTQLDGQIISQDDILIRDILCILTIFLLLLNLCTCCLGVPAETGRLEWKATK